MTPERSMTEWADQLTEFEAEELLSYQSTKPTSLPWPYNRTYGLNVSTNLDYIHLDHTLKRVDKGICGWCCIWTRIKWYRSNEHPVTAIWCPPTSCSLVRSRFQGESSCSYRDRIAKTLLVVREDLEKAGWPTLPYSLKCQSVFSGKNFDIEAWTKASLPIKWTKKISQLW